MIDRVQALKRVLLAANAIALLGATGCGPPMTYADVAAEDAKTCVRNNGDGGWVGSSGVTLEDYCKLKADLKIMERLKKEHPERF